jgi:dTMP kinase
MQNPSRKTAGDILKAFNTSSPKREEPPRGRFFVFDGVDGCGKTSIAGKVAEMLRLLGRTVVETKEPGGHTSFYRERVLADPKLTKVTKYSAFLLFLADRNEHLTNLIVPALLEGKDVVCDRQILSTLVFQSENFSPKMVFDMSIQASTVNDIGLVLPDVTTIVTAPVDQIVRRLNSRKSQAATHFDSVDPAVVYRRSSQYIDRASQLHEMFSEKGQGSWGAFSNPDCPEAAEDDFLVRLQNHAKTLDYAGRGKIVYGAPAGLGW